MVFHWSLSDSKSPQVSRTPLSILAFLNNAVVWMVSNRPPTSKSSSSFNSPLVIVPKAPITIDIIITVMFHVFFFNSQGQGQGTYTFFSLSFSFIRWLAGTAKSTILKVLFFLLITLRSCLLAKIRWSVCLSKSHDVFLQNSCWVVHIPFVRMGKLNYYYSLIWAFHTSVSRWFLTGVWVTSSLLKSPGLYLVFWAFSTIFLHQY